MNTAELLTRLSTTLKQDIGPAVDDGYTRTQAFMAAVILERLARQVELEPGHLAAERDDIDQLLPRLTTVLAGSPERVRAALDEVGAARSVAVLGPLVEALHAVGSEEPARGRGAVADPARPAQGHRPAHGGRIVTGQQHEVGS